MLYPKCPLALEVDLYELTMAQAYWNYAMKAEACFEVTVRSRPPEWGFFVMAGLEEVCAYLRDLRFGEAEIDYLRSIGLFSEDFLERLGGFRPQVEIRAMPEGTVFFPGQPILETRGPLPDVQILESYLLNILGFSIIAATTAARMKLAAGDIPILDFGLRRTQGPVAALRAARGAQIAGFAATSNVAAAAQLNFRPSGTMAHSYISAHDSEEAAFRRYIEMYGEHSILLVDTYDPQAGIRKAAAIAKEVLAESGLRIKGIRIDSGDLAALSQFARRLFRQEGVEFLKIFLSSGLDEFRIADLLARGAQADGFGVGTAFAVSRFVPAIDIVYKIIRYDGRDLYKTSPDKHSRPGRKSVFRHVEKERFVRDEVTPYRNDPSDLLRPLEGPAPLETIQQRLAEQLDKLPDGVKQIRHPAVYPVDFIDPPSLNPVC